MEGKYANIIVDISHEKVDRPFQYKIPDKLQGRIEAGSCVKVPFGTGNKPIKGYVTEITDRAEYDTEKLKEIIAMEEGAVSAKANAIRLAWWMKNTYGSTMINALKTVLPVKKETKRLEKRPSGALYQEKRQPFCVSRRGEKSRLPSAGCLMS